MWKNCWESDTIFLANIFGFNSIVNLHKNRRWLLFLLTCRPGNLHIMHCILFCFLLFKNDMHHYSVPRLCSLIVVWHQKHASSCCQATCLAVFDYETSFDREAFYGWFEVECFFDFSVSLSKWTIITSSIIYFYFHVLQLLYSCCTVVLQLVLSTFMFYSCFSNLSSLFLMTSLQKILIKKNSNKQIHSFFFSPLQLLQSFSCWGVASMWCHKGMFARMVHCYNALKTNPLRRYKRTRTLAKITNRVEVSAV